MAITSFYSSTEEAYQDVKKGHIVGYLHFKPNFTRAIDEILGDGRVASDETFDQRELTVRMDKSDQQITYFLERRLLDTFHDFAEQLMVDCKFPKNLVNVPVNFVGTFHGTLNDEYTDFVAPGIIMTYVSIQVK